MRFSGRMALVMFIVNVVVLALLLLGSRFVPAAPNTNRKIRIAGSRFEHTPLPAGAST
jgi:hypothetical protein